MPLLRPWHYPGARRARVRIGLISVVMAPAISFPTGAAAKTALEGAGDYLQILVPVVAYDMARRRKDTEGERQFWLGYLTTIGATTGLKFAVPEQRPSGGGQSYVSGHTSSAFAGAAFIQMRYGWVYGAPAYLAAAFTGYTRIEAGRHYWGDVWRGAALAVLSAWFFTTPYSDTAVLIPVVTPRETGLSLGISW